MKYCKFECRVLASGRIENKKQSFNVNLTDFYAMSAISWKSFFTLMCHWFGKNLIKPTVLVAEPESIYYVLILTSDRYRSMTVHLLSS